MPGTIAAHSWSSPSFVPTSSKHWSIITPKNTDESQASESSGSGVATPRHTRACAHVKFAGAWVKIMWKPKVKGQVLTCVRLQVLCEHEASVQVRLNEWYLWPKTTSEALSECIFPWRERVPDFLAGVCYALAEWCSYCAHETCSSWLHHWVVDIP